MALTTDFNVNPYYDDYDEDKSFYRVLFRPGYAVQAREVTQLQTILQKQIERHGRHTFDEGSIVLGCELNYDNKVQSLKLESQFAGSDLTINNFSNGVVTGATSNARAKIVATAASTTSDQPTLMFQYLNNNEFSDGETITVEGTTVQANTVSTTGASGLANAVANGSVVSINTGVFYVGGYFVFKDAETLILEKYSDTPSYRVGLQVTESIVTSDTDTSLLDPAQGAYNYAAQGANRYKIVLDLSAKTFTATDPVENAADENFFQLLKVLNGVKQEETKYPVYSELEKTLARRTFDESGDYTVTPFNLQLATHQGITGRTINAASTSVVKGIGTNFESDFSQGDVIFLSGNTTPTATIDTITNARHPYAGELVHTAFSGSHQDAINKGMKAMETANSPLFEVPYLPIDPKDIGRDYEAIIRVNSQSGKGGVSYILENDYSIRLPKAAQAQFSQVIQKITDATSQEITPEEIWKAFQSTFIEQNGPFQLISFSSEAASRSNDLERMTATVTFDGTQYEIKGTGNGPIAAFIQGMRDTFDLKFRLKDYTEHTRTAGSASEAAAYIELKVPDEDGASVFGVGIDTSITLAPIKAVISALNRM